MNHRMICRVLGLILLSMTGVLILPLIAGLCFGESVANFLITMAVSAAAGGGLLLIKPVRSDIYAREGFVIVGLGWILMSLIGALPFVLNGDVKSYVDAVFETVSGFTTTGASVIDNVESLSRGNAFWRLFTHFIGGMGMLVFIMAVLPMSGEHSMHIMRAEVPGPTVGKLVPRLRKTATILYLIYFGLTVLEAILLLCGGMSFYDAILHAFATAGTGGFSTRAASIAAFDSVYIEMVIAVFMVLFGINFNLYFLILIGKAGNALKSEELHWFLLIVGGFTAVLAFSVAPMYGGIGQGFRHAFFNTASLISTSGFGTVDFTQWPAYCQVMLVLLMFCGGCAGSTGGGIKLSRIMIVIKSAVADVRHVARPRSVQCVRIDGKRIDTGTLEAVRAFIILYCVTLLACTFIVSFDGFDFTTNFTASVACISNIGPGLGQVGPSGNYGGFSVLSKIVMCFAMLIGRLEFYPILVLFVPNTWKK